MFHRTKQISETDLRTVMSFMSMLSKEVVLQPSAHINCVCEKDDQDAILRKGMSVSGSAAHKAQGIPNIPPSNSIAGSKTKTGEPGEPDDEDSVLRVGTPGSEGGKMVKSAHGQGEEDDQDAILRKGMSGPGSHVAKPQGVPHIPPSNSIAGSKRKPGEPGEPDDEDSVLRIGTPDSDSKGVVPKPQNIPPTPPSNSISGPKTPDDDDPDSILRKGMSGDSPVTKPPSIMDTLDSIKPVGPHAPHMTQLFDGNSLHGMFDARNSVCFSFQFTLYYHK